jgi:hypothetical protein
LAVVGNEPDQYSNGSRNLATWGPEAYTAEFLVRVYSSSSRPSSRCSLISLHPFLLLRFPVLVDEPHFEPQFARSILPSWSVWFVLLLNLSVPLCQLLPTSLSFAYFPVPAMDPDEKAKITTKDVVNLGIANTSLVQTFSQRRPSFPEPLFQPLSSSSISELITPCSLSSIVFLYRHVPVLDLRPRPKRARHPLFPCQPHQHYRLRRPLEASDCRCPECRSRVRHRRVQFGLMLGKAEYVRARFVSFLVWLDKAFGTDGAERFLGSLFIDVSNTFGQALWLVVCWLCVTRISDMSC